MDLEQNNSLAKLPLLKQGEYDTWRLRIESYIQLQDYSLWEIIEEGNSFKPVAQTTREADEEKRERSLDNNSYVKKITIVLSFALD
ncbi:hypothetical protein Tco_1387170 [Tanacetum coccineum]